MSMILNINGYPGVGKLTIGTIVAERLDAKMLDNHTIYNPAFALTEFKSDAHLRLTRAVRDLCYEQVLALPAGTSVVMTNALMADSEWANENWDLIIDLAARRGAPLLNVALTCELDENRRRIRARRGSRSGSRGTLSLRSRTRTGGRSLIAAERRSFGST